MTRETKVGLLVGLGMILLIGIIVSDHLSVVSQQEAADFTHFADGAQRTLNGGSAPATGPAATVATEQARQPVPMAHELRQPQGETTTTDLTVEQPRQVSYPQRAYALHERDQGHGTVQDIVTRDRTTSADTDPSHTAAIDQRLAALQQQGDFVPVRHELDGATYQPGSNTLRFRETAPPPREPSQRMTETPVVIPAATQPTMVVKSGQTLTAIAREHLGDGNRWKEIFELNRDKLDAPESLQAGMQIKLPRAHAPVVQAPAPSPAPAPEPDVRQPQRLQDLRAAQRQGQTPTPQNAAAPSTKTYVVQRGDNLYKIAQKTMGDGGQWRKLYNANKTRISDPNAVQVGTQLMIPQS